MMIIGQISFIHLVKTAGTVILFILLVFMALKFIPQKTAQEYLPDRFVTWQTRIDRFNDKGDEYNKNGTVKINDDNYQVVHAKIALANGGLFGKLPGRGQQRDFLPQAYSDFIYAIIIEELGFVVGGIGVLFLYIMLLFRVGIIARKCGNKLFPKYLVIGCGLIVVLQALTNMAVAVDLIPVTGQPMPLVSRGGTSTIISCLYFGIILSVSRFAANIGNEAEEDDKDLNVGEPVVETSSAAPVTNATSEKTPSDVSALVERAQDIPKDSFVEIDQNKESETESKI
jgi:cell division protein FtsW